MLVQGDPARGEVHFPRQGVQDLLRVDELALDAVGARVDRGIDELARPGRITAVRGAQLRDDEAGLAPADPSFSEADHPSVSLNARLPTVPFWPWYLPA